MRLVLIEWLDAHGSGDWRFLDEPIPDEPLRCRSVGWLLQNGRHTKVIVPHLHENADDRTERQGCGIMTIPTRAIVSVTDIALPRARRARRSLRRR